MNRVYLLRKGVSLDQLNPFIKFINEYKGGKFKAIYYNEVEGQNEGLAKVEELMRRCTNALLFIGNDESSNSPYVNEEILFTNRFGLKRCVFTLDEDKYPSGMTKGIPSTWKMYVNTVYKATPSNILLGIHGIGLIKYFR